MGLHSCEPVRGHGARPHVAHTSNNPPHPSGKTAPITISSGYAKWVFLQSPSAWCSSGWFYLSPPGILDYSKVRTTSSLWADLTLIVFICMKWEFQVPANQHLSKGSYCPFVSRVRNYLALIVLLLALIAWRGGPNYLNSLGPGAETVHFIFEVK